MNAIDYTEKTAVWLYLNRKSDPDGIDAELDRRNNEAAQSLKPKRKRKSKYHMIDTYRETNRWYIDDDGVVHDE
jgi:hypothetical protein